MKLVSCKSALNPPVVYSTDRSKAVVPVLVLLFVALWFILRGDLLYVFPCVILFLCFSVLLVLRSPRLGKRELILAHYCTFENEVLLVYTLEGVSSVANFIAAYEKSQINRDSNFLFVMYSLFSKAAF